jgi:hypothetical protein
MNALTRLVPDFDLIRVPEEFGKEPIAPGESVAPSFTRASIHVTWPCNRRLTSGFVQS